MQMSELMVACGYMCTAFMNSSVPVTKCTIWVFPCMLLCFIHVPLLFSFSLLLFGLLNLQTNSFACSEFCGWYCLTLALINSFHCIFLAYFSSPKVLLRPLSFALFPGSLRSASSATCNASLCDGWRVPPGLPCLLTHLLHILAGKTFRASVPNKWTHPLVQVKTS